MEELSMIFQMVMSIFPANPAFEMRDVALEKPHQ
jgi:hypothetical protein